MILLTILFSLSAHADPCSTGFCGFHPSLPVFGSGSFTNIQASDPASVENASVHIAWGLAIPLLGEHFWGSKGKRIAGWSWIAVSIITEAFFHAPAHPGSAYPSEVRADLITKIVPTILVMDF